MASKEIAMFMVCFGNSVTFLGCFCCSIFYFFARAVSPRGGTTGIEDTYRTLTGITFEAEVKNSLKLFAVAGIQERVSVLA